MLIASSPSVRSATSVRSYSSGGEYGSWIRAQGRFCAQTSTRPSKVHSPSTVSFFGSISARRSTDREGRPDESRACAPAARRRTEKRSPARRAIAASLLPRRLAAEEREPDPRRVDRDEDEDPQHVEPDEQLEEPVDDSLQREEAEPQDDEGRQGDPHGLAEEAPDLEKPVRRERQVLHRKLPERRLEVPADEADDHRRAERDHLDDEVGLPRRPPDRRGELPGVGNLRRIVRLLRHTTSRTFGYDKAS